VGVERGGADTSSVYHSIGESQSCPFTVVKNCRTQYFRSSGTCTGKFRVELNSNHAGE
jgi:hypothetical protein